MLLNTACRRCPQHQCQQPPLPPAPARVRVGEHAVRVVRDEARVRERDVGEDGLVLTRLLDGEEVLHVAQERLRHGARRALLRGDGRRLGLHERGRDAARAVEVDEGERGAKDGLLGLQADAAGGGGARSTAVTREERGESPLSVWIELPPPPLKATSAPQLKHVLRHGSSRGSGNGWRSACRHRRKDLQGGYGDEPAAAKSPAERTAAAAAVSTRAPATRTPGLRWTQRRCPSG